jgi:acetyl-CoA carboxylase biotin carboxyl carrier protein
MDLNLIKRLVKIVDTSGITDLEIEENGIRVKIAKKVRQAQVAVEPQVFDQTNQTEVKVEEKPKQVEETIPANLHEIRSPIVGTFYRAPAPDADNYAEIGDQVSPGTVLCIVEAMKLMNEIESDVSGKIIKILVENGKPVEYNQPLYLIETS